MSNFDLKKYLAEGNLFKEIKAKAPYYKKVIDFPEMDNELEGALEAGDQTKEEYLQDIIDTPFSEFDLSGYYEVKNAIEQEDYSEEQAIKLMKAWAESKLSK